MYLIEYDAQYNRSIDRFLARIAEFCILKFLSNDLTNEKCQVGCLAFYRNFKLLQSKYIRMAPRCGRMIGRSAQVTCSSSSSSHAVKKEVHKAAHRESYQIGCDGMRSIVLNG